MARCCLWAPREGEDSLVDVPTICDAHRAELALEDAPADEETAPGSGDLMANPYARTLVDADGIDACRRAIDWRRSNRSWMTSVETEDK